jgi:hypothetical protein
MSEQPVPQTRELTEEERTLVDIEDIISMCKSRILSPLQALVDIRAQLDTYQDIVGKKDAG